MKKVLKVILIIFIIICVAVGALAIWQRKNIEGILIGIRETSEEIEKRRAENQENLVKEVDAVLQNPVREISEEEKKKIESGEVLQSDVYAQIFQEENEKLQQTQTLPPSDEKQPQSAANQNLRDEIITKHMMELYNLQSAYTAKAEATIRQGDRYYENLKDQTNDKESARAGTISHFTSTVRSIEAQCDADVEKVIASLTAELSAIGENTDITVTIRETYENEKQLKLAYYSNKYLK